MTLYKEVSPYCPRLHAVMRAWAQAVISPSKGWDRRLGIVKTQIEAGASVQNMEDAIQGDFRLVVAREQRERKGRDWLVQGESNQ